MNVQHASPSHCHVELVKAADLAGEAFYAFLLLPRALIKAFQAKLTSNEAFRLEKFGVVLLSGKGHTPSDEHLDYIRQRFGQSAA